MCKGLSFGFSQRRVESLGQKEEKRSKRRHGRDRQAKKNGNKEGKIHQNKGVHWSKQGANVIDSFS